MATEKKIKEFIIKMNDKITSLFGRTLSLTDVSLIEQDLIDLLGNNWTSVKDELPKKYDGFSFTDNCVVIALDKKIPAKSQVAIASYDYHKQEWTTHWEETINDVTHWQKPPKE